MVPQGTDLAFEMNSSISKEGNGQWYLFQATNLAFKDNTSQLQNDPKLRHT